MGEDKDGNHRLLQNKTLVAVKHGDQARGSRRNKDFSVLSSHDSFLFPLLTNNFKVQRFSSDLAFYGWPLSLPGCIIRDSMNLSATPFCNQSSAQSLILRLGFILTIQNHSHYRIEWDGMGWDGMGWDGMGWDGMGWDGMEWDGMEWNGMGWENNY